MLALLGSQANFVEAEGAAEQARPLLEEALALYRTLGDQWQTGLVGGDLGLAACAQGDLATARRLAREAVAIAQATGDARQHGYGLELLGQIACAAGDATEATRLWGEAITALRAVDDVIAIAVVEGRLGYLAVQDGRYAEGRARCVASLQHLYERGAIGWGMKPLIGLTLCLLAQGEAERGVRVAAALDAFYAAQGFRLLAAHRDGLERGISAARSAIGEIAVSTAWAGGQALTLEQAIAEALGEDGAPSPFSATG
jgi:tetratricopeptide (TPR) repeat protein